jgi:hypothetical protein
MAAMTDTVLAVAHLVAMVFAAFRLTEIVYLDRVTEPLRRRYRHYLWTCPRCLSVWMGGVAVGIYLVFPWLNWPLALSWFFIMEIDLRSLARAWRRA